MNEDMRKSKLDLILSILADDSNKAIDDVCLELLLGILLNYETPVSKLTPG